jgi:hypothetical protein
MYETLLAPRTSSSLLCTFMSAHLCASVPNVKIMETDVDSVPWRDDIITELPDNPGKSVTNAMEWIATVVVHRFDLDPARTRWIEHYPDRHPSGREGDRVFDESFSLVSLGWERGRSPWGQPSPWASGVDWQPLTRAEVTRMLDEFRPGRPDCKWHCAVCGQPIRDDDAYFECASCDKPLCTSCGPGHCPGCLQDKGGIGGVSFRLDA